MFVRSADMLVEIRLNGTSLLFFLATAISWKSFKIFTVKQKNTMQLSYLLNAVLGSMTGIISQAMQDGGIIYFHNA